MKRCAARNHHMPDCRTQSMLNVPRRSHLGRSCFPRSVVAQGCSLAPRIGVGAETLVLPSRHCHASAAQMLEGLGRNQGSKYFGNCNRVADLAAVKTSRAIISGVNHRLCCRLPQVCLIGGLWPESASPPRERSYPIIIAPVASLVAIPRDPRVSPIDMAPISPYSTLYSTLCSICAQAAITASTPIGPQAPATKRTSVPPSADSVCRDTGTGASHQWPFAGGYFKPRLRTTCASRYHSPAGLNVGQCGA